MAHTGMYTTGRILATRSAADAVRRPTHTDGTDLDPHELVRLGTLAASSHNTQPWRFRIVDESTIEVRPDLSRRCPVADPDDAHLFQSLGCAVENVVQAASLSGVRVDVAIDEEEPAIRLVLHDDPQIRASRLAPAIVDRQCTRARFDGRPVDPDAVRSLEDAALGEGVRAIVLSDPGRIRMAAQFVERGNADQIADPAFRRELIHWMRPNDRNALDRRDGLWTRATGAPSIPSPLATWVLRVALRRRSQIGRDTEAIESSAGLAIVVSRRDDLRARIEAGRSVERMLLSATADGLRTAFVNQPIEVSWLRPEFERWLGLSGEHAQLMIRFGTGPTMPFSLRRPLSDVLDDDRERNDSPAGPAPSTAARPRGQFDAPTTDHRRDRVRPPAASAAGRLPAPDEERPLDDETIDDETIDDTIDGIAELDVPFEAPVADVLDQHRDVHLGIDDERSR